ncbi:MAG TPA: hypothetical protein VEQ65_14455, partial [Opitutus sp.]|nr:hypothetical protein [Opitutus sp.]
MTLRLVLRPLVRLGLLVAACSVALCASTERGLPLIKAYSRLEHKAHSAFHAPFISADGLYYAGNQLALMEFDGRAWRILKIPLTYTRALAPDAAGNIYVGDEEQFGVVTRPGSGDPEFTSLLEHVPADAKPFGFVRDLVAWRGEIYAATDKNILRYHPVAKSVRVWPLSGDHRNRLRLVGDRLILHRRGLGLYELRDDEWQPLSNDPKFAAAPDGGFVVAGNAGAELLVGLSRQGLFRVGQTGALQPWPTDADKLLARTGLLAGTRLHDGSIAIGTESEGLVILSADGRLERHLSRE